MKCSQSHRAGKLRFSSSSRSRQTHQETQSCPEFPSKFNKISRNWSCSETHSLQEIIFISDPASPSLVILLHDKTRTVSNSLSLRNTCYISCSFLFPSTSLMRFSPKNCFKTTNTEDRSWSCLSNKLGQMSRKFALYFFYFPNSESAGHIAFCIVTSALKNILLYEKSFLLVVVFLTIFILDIINV